MNKLRLRWSSFSELREELQSYNEIADIGEIARRYFAMNAFDGVLTTIGVLAGNYLAGVRDLSIPVRTGIATSIAMGISGLWGAYLTESAERRRELAELEKVSLIDQRQTSIGKASRFAAIVVSIVDGIAPALAAIIVLIPLFLGDLIQNPVLSYALAGGLALLSLFALGLFLGKVSEENLIGYGLKTLLAGLAAIAINFLLGAEH
jgi:predicted membrane protein (TIGR00267 family)